MIPTRMSNTDFRRSLYLHPNESSHIMPRLSRSILKTPLGICVVEADTKSVLRVYHTQGPKVETNSSQLTERCTQQLREYFAGTRKTFDLPLDLSAGTAFQNRVWKQLLRIPYGETRTYKQVASEMGVQAYRAVGSACGANPLQIVVPCHRVVSTSGLGGYANGLEAKRLLLKIENTPIAFKA
jgi:methylated-DNA-[protein]-cysteine S-methyltransferase